jgi:hypothetical protein
MNTIVGSIKERLKTAYEDDKKNFHKGHIHPDSTCKTEICTKQLSFYSESNIVGGYCAQCRNEFIPSHIPLEQHGMYLDKLFKRRADGKEEEESINKHSKQESKS